MKRRVTIARVLANNASILLMDEPFAALDALTREQLQRELLQIWTQNGVTVVFVTHSVEEAALLADRVLVMSAAPDGSKTISKLHCRARARFPPRNSMQSAAMRRQRSQLAQTSGGQASSSLA